MISIPDMSQSLGVTITLGEAVVDNVNCAQGFTTANHEIVRLDIAMKVAFVVEIFYSAELARVTHYAKCYQLISYGQCCS